MFVRACVCVYLRVYVSVRVFMRASVFKAAGRN